VIAGRARSPAWAIRGIAEYGVEAAQALLARLVDHRACLQAPLPLVALRVLSGRERLAGSPLPCAGIGGLRRSAALLVASSCMIRASIEGYLASGDRCTCDRNVVSEKGCAHRG